MFTCPTSLQPASCVLAAISKQVCGECGSSIIGEILFSQLSMRYIWIQPFIHVIFWEAGVWLPALNNFCHCFLSSAVLLKTTYFPFIRSLSRCILFLLHVAFPSFRWLYHAAMIRVLAHALTTHLHFPTMSNIVLVSFTLYRTFSLLILSTHLIFSILLQIHISMADNLFMSAWVIVCFWCIQYHTPQHTLYYLFFNAILMLPVNSFFLFINACLHNAVLWHISVPHVPAAEITLLKYLDWSYYVMYSISVKCKDVEVLDGWNGLNL